MVKDYFKRICTMGKPWEYVFWWALRIAMIVGIIIRLIESDKLGMYQPMQMAANLLGMFALEICQMFPKGTFPRLIPAYVQNITALCFFIASFGGAFLNFYYSIPAYDKICHMLGCMEAAFIGYELICAMQLRDKMIIPGKIVALCSFGIAFIFASGWELFEFVFDQWFGGDCQHWDLELAIQEAGGNRDNIFMLIPLDDARFEARFALMDTMGDAILNAIGAVIMYIILRIRPYRHMGKNNINKIIEADLAKNAKEEATV